LILRRGHTRAFADLLVWPAMIWLGMVFFALFVLLASDLVRVVLWAGRGFKPIDPERRLWLKRLFGSGIAVAAGGAGVASLISGLGRPSLKEVTVPLRRLPAALDGTTIVQITDVHVGSTIGRSFIEDLVRRVNELHADVIAITGDLVDGTVEEIGHAVAPLAELRAKHGVFFVTGNHEYYAGAEPWLAELTRLGVRVLRNERVSIGEGDASFDLAGVDDFSSGTADIPGALAGRDPSRELVLLAHQPRAIRQAAAHGVGLQLSGHTHGGQLWPWRYMVYLQQPFVSGLHREKDSYIYVSCGTGYWGPPMRLGAPAEITRIVLKASNGA
jgi:predicted MPP superfamily phosphohydrolase